jgi:hypothetical protein
MVHIHSKKEGGLQRAIHMLIKNFSNSKSHNYEHFFKKIVGCMGVIRSNSYIGIWELYECNI